MSNSWNLHKMKNGRYFINYFALINKTLGSYNRFLLKSVKFPSAIVMEKLKMNQH